MEGVGAVMLMRCFIYSLLFLIIFGCDKTLEVPSKGNKEAPRQENLRVKSSSSLHDDGLKLYNSGKYMEAINVWEEELKQSPDNASTYNNIGLAYKKLNIADTAIRYSRKAIEVDPNYGHAYYSLGIALFDTRDFKSALAAFQKSIEKNYKPADSYDYLAMIYRETDDCEKALEVVKKAIEIEPSYAAYLQPHKEACEEEIKEQQRFRLSTISFCDEEIRDYLCVEDDAASIGKLITILSGKNNKTCHARAVERSEINDAIESRSGTKLKDVDCGKFEEGAVAVINEEVMDYEVLQFPQLTNSVQITTIDGEIKKQGLLKKFTGKDYSKDISLELPKIFRYPYPEGNVYFILYDPQPFILKYNDMYNIISDENECIISSIVEAFRLNKRYYAWVWHCACGTDACGNEFIEIKKPQIEEESSTGSD